MIDCRAYPDEKGIETVDLHERYEIITHLLQSLSR